MQRSVRPKSAKGKVRPTPPSRPRPTQESTTSSNSTQRPFYGRRGYSLRHSGPSNSNYGNTSSKRNPPPKNTHQEMNLEGPGPSQFPEVSRPVSSLSKYRILPTIPKTPGSNFRVDSPTESVSELDLLSSFAQQMILDSATANVNKNNSRVPNSTAENTSVVNMKRAAASNVVGKISNNHNQDSPQHKKSRTATTTTKSVFPQRTSRTRNTNQIAEKKGLPREPTEGEPRLKLGLKLPDGKRIERYFAPTGTINEVMNFAQTKMKVPIKRCAIYSMLQVPKEKIANWKRSLAELGFTDRTMLYIDEE